MLLKVISEAVFRAADSKDRDDDMELNAEEFATIFNVTCWGVRKA